MAGWGYELTGDESLRAVALQGAETFSRFWEVQNEVIGKRPELDVWMAGSGPSVKDRYLIPQKPTDRRRWGTAVDWEAFGEGWAVNAERRELSCNTYRLQRSNACPGPLSGWSTVVWMVSGL